MKSSSSALLLSPLLGLLLFLVSVSEVKAQPSSLVAEASGDSLLSLPALARLNKNFSDELGRQMISKRASVSRGVKGRTRVKDGAKLDTVDELLMDSARKRRYSAAQRTFVYLTYLYDWIGNGETLSITERSLPEKMLWYQVMRTTSDYLIDSPLHDTYRDVLNTLRSWRDYTTVRIGRREPGVVDLEQKSSAKGDTHLMEFKFHMSARDGIEPRLKLSDGLVVKYDVFRDETMLEFRVDF